MTRIDKKTKQELFNYAVEQFNREYYLTYEELKYNEKKRLERAIIDYHFERVKGPLRELGHTRIVDMRAIKEIWSKLLTERYIDGESPVVALYSEIVKLISTGDLSGSSDDINLDIVASQGEVNKMAGYKCYIQKGNEFLPCNPYTGEVFDKDTSVPLVEKFRKEELEVWRIDMERKGFIVKIIDATDEKEIELVKKHSIDFIDKIISDDTFTGA